MPPLPAGAAFLLLLVPAAAAAAEPRVDRCRARGDAVELALHLDVAAPVPVVWKVLTDYERLSRFVPGVRRSRRIGVTPEGPLVEHVVVARVLFAERPVRALLQMRERPPHRLQFRSVAGDLPRLRGAWLVQPRSAGRSRVYYACRVTTAARLPAPMLAWAARQESVPRVRALGREAERRARAEVAAISARQRLAEPNGGAGGEPAF
jgi:polyketide cyclase/dehydrase/lipid transport protein